MNSSIRHKENKITFLNLHLGYGGIEISTIKTANALSQKYIVEIISLYNLKDNQACLLNKNVSIKYLYNGEPNREEFLNAFRNRKILKIFFEGFKSLKILFLKRYLIIKEIKNSNSKIIISTRYDFSALLSKYKDKETIAIAQEHHHHNNDKKYINILRRKYNNIDYLFALTPSLRRDYQNFLINNKNINIIVMPNMIELPKKIEKNKPKNVISVGRLSKLKRVNEIISMFPNLNNADKFYIVGDGEEYNNLRNQIIDLKLDKRIDLVGYLSNEKLNIYFNKSSVFVMASITEGLPMVLLEAMSFGLPCIAYETESGVKDIIEDGKNGFIIKNRNKEEYIEKLNLLLKNKKLYDKMSKYAIDTAEKYSSENIFKKWDKIISTILY